MSRHPSVPAILALVSILAAGGCWPFKRNRTPQVPPAVAVEPDSAPRPTLEPPPAGEPPKVKPVTAPPPDPMVGEQPPVGALPAPPLVDEATTPAPPPKKKPQPRRPTSTPPTEPAEPEAESEPSLPVQVPRLTQLLSPQEEREYNREIDERLARIRETIDVLSRRPLREDQMAGLDRVRGFVKQTAETRIVDLVTARNLVRRAELLADDLERSSR